MKKMTRKARPLFKSSAPTPATGPPSTTSTSSSGSGGGGILRRTTWADKIRDKLPPLEENEYEVLWERGVLGVIFLESERDGIPYVSKATETCISPEVQPGDTLKYVNIVRSKDHSFSDFFKILATMKKPVLLRFERANAGTPTSDDEMSAGVPHPGFDQRSNSSSSLGSTSDSPRGSKYQRANSVPPNEQKPPKTSHSRGAFWRASSARDSTIPPPSTSHPSPAPPRADGDDGIFRVGRDHEVSPQHTPNGSMRTPRESVAYQEYEVYWETGSLGLFFGEDRMTNLPVVTRSTSSANAVVQRMVAVNDTLVSANGIQSRDYSFDTFFSRLQQMNKPVRLVFRRPRREASPGKTAPGRKPSMTVDTNLSPGGMNLRHRQLSGGDSPLSGRSNTPPLPPSPHVNVAIGQQHHRESERNPSPSAHPTLPGPTLGSRDRASVKVVSPPSTMDINDARKSRPASSAGILRSSPSGSDEVGRRHLSSTMKDPKDSRASVKMPTEDPLDRFSARVSERRGGSTKGMDTNFRLSSKTSPRTTSPQRNDAGSWSTASPSPTIHTALDDNAPKATTPPHSQPDSRPSPAETSDSYKNLFGPPSPTDESQASPTNVEQGPEVTSAKSVPPVLPATSAKPPSPTPSSLTQPAVIAKPGSPAKPSSPRDIWSMAAEQDPTPPEVEHERAEPETHDDVEHSKPTDPPVVAREDRVSTVSLDEDLDRSDSDSSSDGDGFDAVDDVVEAEAVEVDLVVAEPLESPDVVANDISMPESLPATTRLSSEDSPDDVQAGEIAEIDVGIAVDADDEYQLRDEVDVGSDAFRDDDKQQVEMLDMDGIMIEERSPAHLSGGVDEDADDDEIELQVDAKRGSSDVSDMKVEDPVDEDSEALEPLVSDPDISSDVDVVATSSIGEVSRVKDGVVNSAKVNKPALNANLAKYKKKGKSARGITKLPALAESEAQTVPLVAPNAVNTTVQVRGRPKPKQTMMDTPDGATYLVKWKENRSIGLQLKEVRFGKGIFPLVTDVCQEPCCEALKHICIGDVIVEINGKNTSSMGVKKTVNFLKSCSKTTLMKLRHGPAYVSQRVSAYI